MREVLAKTLVMVGVEVGEKVGRTAMNGTIREGINGE